MVAPVSRRLSASQPQRRWAWMVSMRLALDANEIIESSDEEDEPARRSFVRFIFDSFIGDNVGRSECEMRNEQRFEARERWPKAGKNDKNSSEPCATASDLNFNVPFYAFQLHLVHRLCTDEKIGSPSLRSLLALRYVVIRGSPRSFSSIMSFLRTRLFLTLQILKMR